MKREMDVGIVGGGPIGLFMGLKLKEAGLDVTVYEEHLQIGLPTHCAGLISPTTLKISGLTPAKVVREEIYGIKIGIPRKIQVEYVADEKKAVIIDRVKFDQGLARRLSSLGGEILLSSRASLERSGGETSLRIDERIRSHHYLVDAAGSESYLRRAERDADILPAMQMDLVSGDHDSEMVEIWINKDRNDDFFYWCVPLAEDLVRVGTASRRMKVEEGLTEFVRWRFGDFKPMNRLYGFIILSGYLEKSVDGNILRVGDSAGQTKPTTGGGLRYGLCGAEEAARAIVANCEDSYPLNFYEERWKKLWGREIYIQRLARKTFLSLDEKTIFELLRMMRDEELLPQLLEQGGIDTQSSLIKFLLRNRRIYRIGLRTAGVTIRKMFQ